MNIYCATNSELFIDTLSNYWSALWPSAWYYILFRFYKWYCVVMLNVPLKKKKRCWSPLKGDVCAHIGLLECSEPSVYHPGWLKSGKQKLWKAEGPSKRGRDTWVTGVKNEWRMKAPTTECWCCVKTEGWDAWMSEGTRVFTETLFKKKRVKMQDGVVPECCKKCVALFTTGWLLIRIHVGNIMRWPLLTEGTLEEN